MSAETEMIVGPLVGTTTMTTEDTVRHVMTTREIPDDGQEVGNHIEDMTYTAPAGEILHDVGQNHQNRNAMSEVGQGHENDANVVSDLQWSDVLAAHRRLIVMFPAQAVALLFQLLVLAIKIENGTGIEIEIGETVKAIDQKIANQGRAVRLARAVRPDNDIHGKKSIVTYLAPPAVQT
jgi:hypothetical protein